jgi:hypothetical protein
MGNRQSDAHDALLAGRAAWTLAFWFALRAAAGTVLLAGIGDPARKMRASSDSRTDILGLWLGRGQGPNHLLAAQSALARPSGIWPWP